MENKIIHYGEIDTYLFKNIKDFKVFYESKYSTEDLKLKYVFMSAFIDFIKTHYLDNQYNIVGDKLEFENIIAIINTLYLYGDDKTQELVIIGFIEGLLPSDKKLFNKFKNILHYDDLKDKAKELINFWY